MIAWFVSHPGFILLGWLLCLVAAGVTFLLLLVLFGEEPERIVITKPEPDCLTWAELDEIDWTEFTRMRNEWEGFSASYAAPKQPERTVEWRNQ